MGIGWGVSDLSAESRGIPDRGPFFLLCVHAPFVKHVFVLFVLSKRQCCSVCIVKKCFYNKKARHHALRVLMFVELVFFPPMVIEHRSSVFLLGPSQQSTLTRILRFRFLDPGELVF